MALLVACLAWLVGLGLALGTVAPEAAVAAVPLLWGALALPLLLTGLLARAYPLRLVALGVALLLLGWARGLSVLPALAENSLAPYYGSVVVRGAVSQPAAPGDAGVRLRLAATAVERAPGEWEPVSGQVLLRLPRTAPYDYGDVLEARGRLRPLAVSPAGGVDAALRREGVRGTMDYPDVSLAGSGAGAPPQVMLHALRRHLEAAISGALPEPHASLLIGLLLGGSATLPPDFREAMRAVGLTHLTAVSGFNVTLVAVTLIGVCAALVGRRAGWPLAALGIVAYTVLVGAPPSAVRAAAMALVALAAETFGRPRDGLSGLALGVAVLAAWDPWLVADLGFQLSALGTAGLLVLQPALRVRLGRLPAWAAEGLAATLAAQAFVLPVQLAAFHYLSPVSPLVNVLVVPLVPPLMALGLAVALVGLVAPGLGLALAILPWGYLEIMVRVIEAGAALPGARLDTGALPPLLGAVYGVGLALLALVASPEARRVRAFLGRVGRAPALRWGAAGIVVLIALATLTFAARPDGRLHVAILDVGQGDATLVRTPSGRLLLVDGGPSPAALLAHLGNRLGPAERHVHLVALTHPHEDHVAGLIDVVERYSVGQVVEGAVDYVSTGAERWRALLRQRAVPAVPGASGQQWQLDDGVVLDVWAIPPLPGSRADRAEPAGALVLRLRYGATSILFPGDLVAEQAHRILAVGGDLRATALLVPHHGSRTGLDADLLRAVQPTLALVSSGERNRFGHPAPQTLALLDAHGVPVWRTDRDGTIELTSDGTAWAVRALGKGR